VLLTAIYSIFVKFDIHFEVDMEGWLTGWNMYKIQNRGLEVVIHYH